MNGKINTAHLRKVGLTAFDTQVLGLLMKCGGEYPMPQTKAAIAGLEVTRGKGLVEMVSRWGRTFVRLTDEGRAVCAQLEAMAVQPKMEVVNQ